jgi:hypothetical protein
MLVTAEKLGGSLQLAEPQRAVLAKFGVTEYDLLLALDIGVAEGVAEVYGTGLTTTIRSVPTPTDRRSTT